MAWYRAGTIALTNGSTTVTGSGTAFIANVDIGEGLVAPDGRIYEIQAIGSDTQLTLARTYLGATASGQSYAIAPIRGRISDLISETQSLLGSFATVRDGIGAGLFPDGTVSLPGFRFAADQDTGLRRVSSNTMAMVTGGVDRLTADSNGNVGIGPVSGSPFRLTVANNTFDGVWAGSSGTFSLVGLGGFFGGAAGAAQIGFERSTGAFTLGSGTRDSVTARLRMDLDGTVRPGADNLQDFGTASNRWKAFFAVNGAIQTSDAREKVWRGPPEEAAQRAANRIIGELGFFQWSDAVEEKGEDGARIHFGVRAQEVIRIMVEEGLEDEQTFDFAPGTFVPKKSRPSFRHGFLCFDTWDVEMTDEMALAPVPVVVDTGLLDDAGKPVTRTVIEQQMAPTGKRVIAREPGNRFGLRIDQLTMFLLAALAQRVVQQQIETSALAAQITVLATQVAALESKKR